MLRIGDWRLAIGYLDHRMIPSPPRPRRIIVALTGASGAIYGIRALEMLRTLGVESHLVLSPAAHVTIAQETDFKVSEVTALASVHYDRGDIGARAGAGIFPPVPAFYGRPQTLDEVITATAGRALLRLGIDNPGYARWEGMA